jgi:hypothetical protein
MPTPSTLPARSSHPLPAARCAVYTPLFLVEIARAGRQAQAARGERFNRLRQYRDLAQPCLKGPIAIEGVGLMLWAKRALTMERLLLSTSLGCAHMERAHGDVVCTSTAERDERRLRICDAKSFRRVGTRLQRRTGGWYRWRVTLAPAPVA